jgi:uncharacterized protein YdaU (DUF1376 family)
MGKAPAFQTFASDYYVDTNSWRVEEIGIYQRLLLTEWVNGGLPSDKERLARIAGCSIKKFQKAWTTISTKFKNGFFWESKEGLSIEIDRSLLESNKLYNVRMEIERQKQRKYHESQSNRAKLRWNPQIADALADGMPTHMPEGCSSSSSSILYNNKEKISTSKCGKVKTRYYKDERGNYICSLCQKPFMQYNNLQDHFKEHN